jgi:AraC-like DNA-binding protein
MPGPRTPNCGGDVGNLRALDRVTDHDALLNDMVHTFALSPHALARSRRSAEDCLRYVYITQERVHKSQDMLARSDRLIAQLHDLGYEPSGMSDNRTHHGAACTCSSAVAHSLHLSDFTEPLQSPRPLLRGRVL